MTHQTLETGDNPGQRPPDPDPKYWEERKDKDGRKYWKMKKKKRPLKGPPHYDYHPPKKYIPPKKTGQ